MHFLHLNYRTMKTCERTEVRLHAFLKSVLYKCSTQLRVLVALPTEKLASWKSLTKRLAGLYRWSRRFGEHDISLPLKRIEPRFTGLPARGLVTVLTELSERHYVIHGTASATIFLLLLLRQRIHEFPFTCEICQLTNDTVSSHHAS